MHFLFSLMDLIQIGFSLLSFFFSHSKMYVKVFFLSCFSSFAVVPRYFIFFDGFLCFVLRFNFDMNKHFSVQYVRSNELHLYALACYFFLKCLKFRLVCHMQSHHNSSLSRHLDTQMDEPIIIFMHYTNGKIKGFFLSLRRFSSVFRFSAVIGFFFHFILDCE